MTLSISRPLPIALALALLAAPALGDDTKSPEKVFVGYLYGQPRDLNFGLYTHPSEWPWEFIFIIVICWLFLINAAGRSLGLDAILRRLPAVLKSDSLIARLYRLAS